MQEGIERSANFLRLECESPLEPTRRGALPPKTAPLVLVRPPALMALITEVQPGSRTELSELSGRAKPNLSRTLKTTAAWHGCSPCPLLWNRPTVSFGSGSMQH